MVYLLWYYLGISCSISYVLTTAPHFNHWLNSLLIYDFSKKIVYGSLISCCQCKEDLLVITYNKLVMNLSQLSKHCLSIVCLNVVVIFIWLFIWLEFWLMSFLWYSYCVDYLLSSLTTITFSLNSIGVLSGIITSISHGFSSVGLFLFAGLLINKTYSRFLDSFFFIDSIFREVLIFFLLANVSFPGSFNLVSEILALINIVWNNSFFCFSFLVTGLFSCYYWFLVLNRKLPYHCCSSSLNWIEWFLFFWLLVLIYFLGFLLILLLIDYSFYTFYCLNFTFHFEMSFFLFLINSYSFSSLFMLFVFLLFFNRSIEFISLLLSFSLAGYL